MGIIPTGGRDDGEIRAHGRPGGSADPQLRADPAPGRCGEDRDRRSTRGNDTSGTSRIPARASSRCRIRASARAASTMIRQTRIRCRTATVLTFALAGNQNCGKTTLFNQLTGSNQHVGNFPGVTVDRKDGTIRGQQEHAGDRPSGHLFHVPILQRGDRDAETLC